tara:strand:- start:59 stop:361 length:303 start_codon:yes stop_codon:yes gene_type:complete
MSINYTYTVIGTTKKQGGNGEILTVHVNLHGIDSSGKEATQQFATALNPLAHTDSNFIADPTDEQKLTWAKAQWNNEGADIPTLTKLEEAIKAEIETGDA